MQATLFPVRNRLTRRLFRLRGPDALPLTLVAQRIYILPTRQGQAFILLLMGMLLGSVNYGLAMGYLFTFLLMGMLLAALFATWRNLVGLHIQAVESDSAFAGEPVRFVFHLAESQGRAREAIALRALDAATPYTRVPAGGQARLVLVVPGRRRGYLPLGVCRLYSDYPLGLFQAWALPELQTSALIWPRPAGPYALPAPRAQEVGEAGAKRRGTEDFDSLRAYERGENPARIVWKTLARHGEPLAKGFISPLSKELWLDWDALVGLDTEARLCQLARWVVEAERSGHAWGLKLPGQTLPQGSGAAQRTRCLNALALYGRPQA